MKSVCNIPIENWIIDTFVSFPIKRSIYEQKCQRIGSSGRYPRSDSESKNAFSTSLKLINASKHYLVGGLNHRNPKSFLKAMFGFTSLIRFIYMRLIKLCLTAFQLNQQWLGWTIIVKRHEMKTKSVLVVIAFTKGVVFHERTHCFSNKLLTIVSKYIVCNTNCLNNYN